MQSADRNTSNCKFAFGTLGRTDDAPTEAESLEACYSFPLDKTSKHREKQPKKAVSKHANDTQHGKGGFKVSQCGVLLRFFL